MSAAVRKPWPMRWIVASILLFIVPYTYVNLKFRKPNKAFEPYADMKAQANVKRLLDAGYTRVAIRAERPHPPLSARQLLPEAGLLAVVESAPGGLPPPLDTTLVEAPRLPAGYADLLAPAELAATAAARLQFTAHIESDREQLAGADVYVRDDTIVIAPTFEPVPGDLQSRARADVVLLTLPAGVLAPGAHTVTLAGARDSLRWTMMVR
jgi:hypothetical protein